MRLPKSAKPGPVERARVLIVTDRAIGPVVALALNHGVFSTRIVADLTEAEGLRKSWAPQLVIVDLDMRDSPLFLIGGRVRARRLPTIALTSRGDFKAKMDAFERGVDDIVAVPFVPEELVARVLAVMRRAYGEGVRFVPVISAGGLKIDLLNQEVTASGRKVPLTGIEQALLYLLASHPGETVARQTILDAVWGRDYAAESNVVDRHVRNLRGKLHDHWRTPRYIATVSGKGYRFVAE
jgi:DNA-binding response OmpR family regulator